MVTEPPGWSGSKRCKPAPGSQARGWKGEGRRREGQHLHFRVSRQHFQLVNFQNISHKEINCRYNCCSPIICFWGFWTRQCGLMSTYPLTIICIHGTLVKVSGSLYLELFLSVIQVPCSNKQHEFQFHLLVFILFLSWSQNHAALAWARKKKIAYSCKNLQENELFPNNELLTPVTTAESLQWCQPLLCQ